MGLFDSRKVNKEKIILIASIQDRLDKEIKAIKKERDHAASKSRSAKDNVDKVYYNAINMMSKIYIGNLVSLKNDISKLAHK